ncbi:MAG: hypothetical protein JWP44_4465 [Mucilaginibacter sp.]|nr:hypothetical protein [Mucilaginibacter sp.]
MPGVAVTLIGGVAGYQRGALYTSVLDPTTANDGTSVPPHQVGDRIVNTSKGTIWTCVSNGTGAANWQSIGGASPNGRADSVAISAVASTANVSLVTFQVVDNKGVAIAAVFDLDIWLSDAATGAGLTATTASGAVTPTVGIDLIDYTAKKAFHGQTNASGILTLSITDTAKTLFFPCVQVPGSGLTVVGTRLTTPKYG